MPLRLLAIETATRACSIAACDENGIMGEFTLTVPHIHAERLMPMINEMTSSLGLEIGQFDAVAVSNGPGSFTGLRIGLSVAKGIAFATDMKIIAVPTLDSLAYRYRNLRRDGKIVSLLHARGNEFYYCSYEFVNSTLGRSGEYMIGEAPEIAKEIPAGAVFVGEGAAQFRLTEIAKEKFGAGSFIDEPASAVEVALLGKEKFYRNEFGDVTTIVPLYIKDFVAVKRNPLNKLLERI